MTLLQTAAELTSWLATLYLQVLDSRGNRASKKDLAACKLYF